ncbi:unnamed protein product [Gadus morhua 'NCC']
MKLITLVHPGCLLIYTRFTIIVQLKVCRARMHRAWVDYSARLGVFWYQESSAWLCVLLPLRCGLGSTPHARAFAGGISGS